MLCCYSSIAGAGLHQAGWFPCRKNTRAADVLSFQRDPRHAGGGALAVTRLECAGAVAGAGARAGAGGRACQAQARNGRPAGEAHGHVG